MTDFIKATVEHPRCGTFTASLPGIRRAEGLTKGELADRLVAAGSGKIKQWYMDHPKSILVIMLASTFNEEGSAS